MLQWELLEQSPPDARLAVIGSGIFLADSVIDLQSQAAGTRYLNSLQFIQNLVDRLFEEPGGRAPTVTTWIRDTGPGMSEEVLRQANYNTVIRESLLYMFPDASGRSGRRALGALVSNSAPLAGTTVE